MKKLLAILLALAMVFSLVACGSSSDGNTSGTDNAGSQTDDANTTDTNTNTDDNADANGTNEPSGELLFKFCVVGFTKHLILNVKIFIVELFVAFAFNPKLILLYSDGLKFLLFSCSLKFIEPPESVAGIPFLIFAKTFPLLSNNEFISSVSKTAERKFHNILFLSINGTQL